MTQNLAALVDLFPFSGGPQLINADQLRQLVVLLFGSKSGIVAHAGGGQAAATPLTAALNSVDTCATDADSVMLPLAIPGSAIAIKNNTAHTVQVFGQVSNPNSAGGVGDTISAQGSTVQQATATGVAQLTGVLTNYICTRAGQWDQGSVT